MGLGAPSPRASSRGGVVLIDKAIGPTSHDVVKRVRKIMSERRVGHCGTLDPLASGLLVVLVGECTRLVPYATESDKRYSCELELGLRTDTDDITGEVIARSDASNVQDADIERALAGLRGEIDQMPPDYSAARVDGVRAHALARSGERPALKSRRVRIEQLELLRRSGVRVEVEALVSKGTYVRSLVRDLGIALGCGATVTALRREAAGQLSVQAAQSLELLAERGRDALLPPQDLFKVSQRLELSEAQAGALWRKGHIPAPAELPSEVPPWIALTRDDVVAVVTLEPGGDVLRTLRAFPAPAPSSQG